MILYMQIKCFAYICRWIYKLEKSVRKMMKKYYFLFVMCLVATLTGYAAKSTGTPRMVVQPDGTTLSVRLLGDEHFSWYQTLDGVLLMRVDDAFYVGRVAEDGSLESTGLLAHEADKRPLVEMVLAKGQDRSRFFDVQRQRLDAHGPLKAIAGYPSTRFCPHMGRVRIPIIMVDYPDKPFYLKDRATWEEYFNGTERTDYSSATKFQGYGSVGMYFRDASNGLFAPEFDFYGPYTMSREHDYYGSHRSTLCTEAVKLADNDIDFSLYDSNGDNKVDMVYVLYAGTGANISGNDNDVWPACFQSLSTSTNDGVGIMVIGCANELAVEKSPSLGSLRAGIGVTCHEMSHGMGLPDLYCTLNVRKDTNGRVDWSNCGPEDWDVMDGGENLFNAMWPYQYTAWERDVMGWMELEELREPATITLDPVNKGGKAYKVVNPENENEYYVIENYAYDEWNKYVDMQYGTGLMIFHIDAEKTGFSMTPNNTFGRPRISILPADDYVLGLYARGCTSPYRDGIVKFPQSDSEFSAQYFRPECQGDPYPGSHNVTSLASYKNYAGEEDMVNRFPITNIRVNEDRSITFDFMGGSPETSIQRPINEFADSPMYRLDGMRVDEGRTHIYHGIYIRNGHKIVR